MQCSNCSYWDALDGNDGLCRRMPPMVVLDDEDEWVSKWPETLASNWCGEFEMNARFEAEGDF